MSNKFEQLLDYLVNEEAEKANELFHEIVVEKSREIYENLIAEEEDEDESMDEAHDEDEDESVEETYEEEETTESIFGEEDDDSDFPVQDRTDDFTDDTVDHDFGSDMDDDSGYGMDDEMDDEMGDDTAPADKGDIRDLEDALEELKAEFEALLAAEKNEEGEMPGVHGEPSPLDDIGDEESDFDDEGEDDEEDEEEGEEDDEEDEDEDEGMTESRRSRTRSQSERMREYIEKVSVSMVDGEGVGSGRGDKAGQTGHDSGKSPISSGHGKPQSGARAIPADTSKHSEDGTSPKGKVGGLVKSGGDFVKSGTKNVAAKASAKKPDGAKLSNVSKPGNKEFAGVGAATGGNKAGQTGSGDTKSPLTGAPNRAK